MKIYPNKQSQFELFPGGSEQPVKKSGSRFFLTALTLSPENFIILGIVLIMSMVVSFSLGVERGKKMVMVKKKQQSQRATVPAHFVPEKKDRIRESETKAAPVPEKAGSVSFSRAEEEAAISGASGQGDTILEKRVEKNYTVQVASFRKEESAQKEAMDLKKKGYEILVLPKGKYSIVCVGKFVQRNEAKVFSRKLKKRYKDCLIRSL